jgi:hypothetical protein
MNATQAAARTAAAAVSAADAPVDATPEELARLSAALRDER